MSTFVCFDLCIFQESWQSVFYQQDRLFTSMKFVSSMKENFVLRGNNNTNNTAKHDYVGIPMPFSLVLFLASSMSHVDDQRAVLDLSFRNCVYNEPVMPGDTLHRHFTIENIRESKNGKNIIVDIVCKLYNQYNENVFRLDKTMFYEKTSINDRKMSLPTRDETSAVGADSILKPNIGPKFGAHSSQFRHFVQKQQHKLPVSSSLKSLYPREIILHSMQRPLGMKPLKIKKTNKKYCQT